MTFPALPQPPAPQQFQPGALAWYAETYQVLAWLGANGAFQSPLGQQALHAQRAQALTPWFAGLANRQSARCNLVCLGDSITEGQGALGPPSTGLEDRWIARLRDLLRARYPTPGITGGGRGFLGTVSTGEGTFTWPATLAGAPPAGTGFGPKSSWIQLNTTGQSVTYSLVGDSADIMWVQVLLGGTFSWAVDGGAATNISTAGGSNVDGKLTRISLGSAGSHTLVLQWVSGNSNVDGVTEYNGDSAAGIEVHDAGRFGASTNTWVTALNNGGANGSAAAIAALKPSAVIISLGVNDQFAGVPPSAFQANLQTIISNLKAQLAAPYPSFVLNMYPPRQNQQTFASPWAAYTQAAWNVAAADTSGPSGNSLVTVMDFTIGPRMPGPDTDTYGLWSDVVHPNDKGHQMIADYLTAFLSQE